MITKKLFRVRVQSVLRKSYLLKAAERLRFLIKVLKLKKRNRKFVLENPNFSLPPAHLAFDAYSSSHWEFYRLSGEITAKFLAAITTKYFLDTNPLTTVYEWGCGPARVIRQLAPVLTQPAELYASDYNSETIDWCKGNIPGVHFMTNDLHPPLPYKDNKFDFVYAISVFTHLSESNSLSWAKELYRVLKPGGILLITVSSDHIYEKELLRPEKKEYDASGIVVRAKYEEGKKMFLAMHSPKYIKEKLLSQFEILEHVPSDFPFMRQDYWIARKGN